MTPEQQAMCEVIAPMFMDFMRVRDKRLKETYQSGLKRIFGKDYFWLSKRNKQ